MSYARHKCEGEWSPINTSAVLLAAVLAGALPSKGTVCAVSSSSSDLRKNGAASPNSFMSKRDMVAAGRPPSCQIPLVTRQSFALGFAHRCVYVCVYVFVRASLPPSLSLFLSLSLCIASLEQSSARLASCVKSAKSPKSPPTRVQREKGMLENVSVNFCQFPKPYAGL